MCAPSYDPPEHANHPPGHLYIRAADWLEVLVLRLEADVGYSVDSPLSRLPIFDLIAARSRADEAELAEVFNMGCGFCCVVPADQVAEHYDLRPGLRAAWPTLSEAITM